MASTSGRYAIVDEPDTMEVVEDDRDIYHPDQSMSGFRQSMRSLEPIVPGPIGMKELFFDPRWTYAQRKICLVGLAIASVLSLALILSLFIGLFRVLGDISHLEQFKNKGVFMYPDITHHTLTTFSYSAANSSDQIKWNADCVKNIDTFFNELKDAQEGKTSAKDFVDCTEKAKPIPKDQLCKLDYEQWNKAANCTKEEGNYGYDNGNPCLLFTFRNVYGEDWKPERNDTVTHMPFKCIATAVESTYQSVSLGYSKYPSEGFDLRYIPTNIVQDGSMKYTHDHPPYVWVKLHQPQSQYGGKPYLIKCGVDLLSTGGVAITNLDQFTGVKQFTFELDPNPDGYIDLTVNN